MKSGFYKKYFLSKLLLSLHNNLLLSLKIRKAFELLDSGYQAKKSTFFVPPLTQKEGIFWGAFQGTHKNFWWTEVPKNLPRIAHKKLWNLQVANWSKKLFFNWCIVLLKGIYISPQRKKTSPTPQCNRGKLGRTGVSFGHKNSQYSSWQPQPIIGPC